MHSDADLPMVPEDPYHSAIHSTFDYSLSCIPMPFPTLRFRYNVRTANYISLYNDLETIDWSFLVGYHDVNSAFKAFYKVLYSVLDKHVPPRTGSTSQYPVWFTNGIIKNLKIKNKFRRRWMSTKNILFLNEFKRLGSLTKILISQAYNTYMTNNEQNIKSNLSEMWKFVNDRRRTTQGFLIMTLKSLRSRFLMHICLVITPSIPPL
ncbi:hypothetical protein QE152_g35010 [Popillia japonica]|uniref:Uncharacterized protein n=1 Tax=Popillia japonica TaxID=7064 RepID=A0AAW1IRS0_POPJA